MIISTFLRVSRWKKYYLIYDIRLFPVVGLAISRYMTNYTVINILAWYFTSHGEDLVTSSILSNIHDSLSSLFVIFMANAAESFVGRFHTVLFSNIAYIYGLSLLLLFNPYDVKWVVVIMLVLLALGTSGDQLLEEVLEDLVNDIDKSTKERSIARAASWSYIAKVFAFILSILLIGVEDSSWGISYLICIGTMAVFLTKFCTAHHIYHQDELIERPIVVFFRVLHVRIKKLLKRKSRRIANSSRLDILSHNLETNVEDEQEDIVIVKSLLRMFPMWGMFFVVSLISATGSTFFVQQYNNLNTTNVAVQTYDWIKLFTRFASPFLYRWICGLRKNEKVKIGVGMLCGMVSCLFAWQLEVQRLKKVNNLDDKDANTSISFLWLVPQFCVLGCMEGLTEEGLLKFYRSQMKEEPLQSYGEEYLEFVMGIGKLLNIFLILIVKSLLGWFGDTINDSRLDKYYLLLVFVCLADFIIYCLIARYYYKDAERHQDSANDDLNQGLEVVANDDQQQDNQVMANDDQEQDINQVAANDDQEQDINQVAANDDQDQDNQLLPNDDQKQDNQLLIHDDHKQENQLLANDNQK